MALADAHDPLEQLGDALRASRQRHRVSQRELAVLLDLHRGVVAKWEAGDGPAALRRVDGVLRLLGYRLAVVPRAAEVAEIAEEDPAPHVRDRASRRYPAHLPVFSNGPPLVREQSPLRAVFDAAGGRPWTYERRPGDRRAFPERVGRETEEPPGQWERGGPSWWPVG